MYDNNNQFNDSTPQNQNERPDYSGWQNGYPAPQAPKPGKNKKKGGFLKIAAAAVAVMVTAFGFGYLGSQTALKTAQSQPSPHDTSSQSDTSSNASPMITSPLSTNSGDEQYDVIQRVAAAVSNSVVEITTEGVMTGDYLRQHIVSGAGSGVIISSDGYIVTNHHVIEESSKITVTLRDGTQYDAVLIGSDEKSDLAMIRVNAQGLQSAVLGSSSALTVGELAIAIGNPLGQLGGTVTNGIISALDRDIMTENGEMTLLQTNAAINPGNSGGGLFNSKGELVGIVNAKSSGENVEGLGFAIPIDAAKTVIEDLTSYGYVRGRVDLGMTMMDVQDAVTAMLYRLNSTGVYVVDVTAGSSAAATEIQSGDRIVQMDGENVASTSDITAIVDKHAIGDTIEIVISRNGRTGKGTITLEEYKGNTDTI